MSTRTRENYRRIQGKRRGIKLGIALLLIVFLGIIITSIIVTDYLQEPEYVSGSIMDKYAQTLVSDYNKNINFFLPTNFSYFPFHSNYSYTAKTIISSNYGAALILYPSDTWSFNDTLTNQRIEEAVFGADNFNFLTRLNFVGNGFAFLAYLGNETQSYPSMKYIGFAVGANSSIIFRDFNINSVPYFFLIVKGSNKTSSWSSNVALNDSRLVFEDDLNFALNKSEAVREYYATPELDTLLMNIITKWHDQLLANHTIDYTYPQMVHDLQQIEELAKTKYGITNNSFINDTLTYLESITLPRPIKPRTVLGINDSENWIYSVLLSLYLPVFIGLFLIFQWVQKKYSEEGVKFLIGTVILEIFFGAIVGDWFFSSYPSLMIIQIIFVLCVWFFGILGLCYGRKKLSSLRFSRVNNANAPQREAENKANSSPNTEGRK